MVPAGVLQQGAEYTWKARSSDGTDYSAYSEVLTLVPVTEVGRDTETGDGSLDFQSQSTEVEPDTFSYGATIVSAFQAGRYGGGGASNIGWATSTDGGATWTGPDNVLPGTTKWVDPTSPWERINDPSVAYDAFHDVWMISALPMPSGGPAYTVYVSRSTNGGTTWDTPVTTVKQEAGHTYDKDWIVCDNTATSPNYGACYVVWADFVNGSGQFHVDRSTNGGTSWTELLFTNITIAGNGAQPIVQPDGRLVIVYKENATDPSTFPQLRWFDREALGGFQGPFTIDDCEWNHQAGGLRKIECFTSAEMDSAGTIYLVWPDCRFRAMNYGQPCHDQSFDFMGPSDLVYTTLAEGASTWSDVALIPAAPTLDSDVFLPGMAVDPDDVGHVGVAFYFYPRYECGDPDEPLCHLYAGFISTADAWTTYHRTTVLGAMSPTWLADNRHCQTCYDYMAGDYISSSVVNGLAYPIFPRARMPLNGDFTCLADTDPSTNNCREDMVVPTAGLSL